jgi:hypothetical protein
MPGKNWIAGAIKRPGALRAKAGVSGDKPIPAKKLSQLANSSNPTTARQANLAKTLKKLGK